MQNRCGSLLLPRNTLRIGQAALALALSLSAVAASAQALLSHPANSSPAFSTSAPPATTLSCVVDGNLAAALVRPAVRPGSEYVSTRPFSALAIRTKIGTEGIGLDLATPLNRHLNLRGGASFYSGGLNPSINNIDIVAHLHLASSAISLDYHPFGGSFRISPGVSLSNNNTLEASAVVPPGMAVTFGNIDYTSSPDDPLYGNSTFKLGNKLGPRLTLGWGNMIPHKRGQHFSMPFEIGAQYIGPPTVQLNVLGSACDKDNQCGPVSMGDQLQKDIHDEVHKLEQTADALKIVPIVSIGLSFKF